MTSLPNSLREQGKLYRLERLRARAQLQRHPPRVEPTEFQQRYLNDPGGFLLDCIQWRANEAPAPYQLEILNAVPERRRVSARGLHGLGKTALSSWLILWFALTRDGWSDWKIPVTASKWRQVAKYTFPEVHKWARRVRWDAVGRAPFRKDSELQTLALKPLTGECFAVVSDEASAIEGAHADQMLYVLDEAKAIPAPIWQAVEGAFSTGEAYALAISTPGETSGVFYDIHKRRPGYEDWWTRHVTTQEAIAAGRVPAEWVEQRKKQWGVNSAVYKNRVLGEFAESGTDTLIPLAWVEAANERWQACDGKGAGKAALGVDVARFGDDRTTIARRVGTVIEALDYFDQLDTMAVTGEVVNKAKRDTALPIQVDVIGIGAGVVDRLREQGYAVTGVNVSVAAKDVLDNDLTDVSGELLFANLRSYGWWLLRERLDPQNADLLALPPDDTLTGDLTAPKWRPLSNGRIQVESKDDMRKRIGRSTDAADGVMLACLDPALFSGRPDWDYQLA